ncbi:MAG: multicopper oxidase domain-containing protein, partial [Frankiaceae bacterium]|nr:multicopper oxidase domain-containing protein [Frankiaceae bacterium]
MGVPSRALTLAALGVLATTAAVGALPATSAHGTAALSAAATTAPCIPNSPPPGTLPQPPTVDASRTPNFTLYVKQGANSQTGQTYCYTTSASGATAYVEAPTIRVKAGATFTMTLVNQIPYTGPSPVPTPASSIIPTTDGCAWLPDDGALPTPYPQMTPPGYFNHARVPVHAMPPWMLDNDTNFHTHGWHVSPYVDNVYKSLVWAPKPNVCTFKFTVRLSQPPGTYWYHAHLHGLSDNQGGGGLAGALIVVPNAPAKHAI